MGMDVYGIAPTSKVGEYFRNSVWEWRPLAAYVLAVAPESLTCHCTYWQSNDADGLDASDSIALANILQHEIDTGDCLKYKQGYDADIAALPLEDCHCCGGTGLRQPPPVVGPGDRPCNGCDSKGKRTQIEANYPFTVEHVQEFVHFLRDCGGFKIN